MKKILFITILFISILNARENPFSPLHMISVQKQQTTIQKINEPIVKPKIMTINKPVVKILPIVQKTIPMAKVIPVKKVEKAPVIKKKTNCPKIKKRVLKKHKKRLTTKLLYANKFTKIQLRANTITIKTKDTLLKEFTLKHPNRIVFDFERFDAVKTTTKKVYSKNVKNFKIGHHDYFYRVIFTLGKNKRYKLIKKPYGYAISIL